MGSTTHVLGNECGGCNQLTACHQDAGLEQLTNVASSCCQVGAAGAGEPECEGYMAIPSSGRARLAAVQSF